MNLFPREAVIGGSWQVAARLSHLAGSPLAPDDESAVPAMSMTEIETDQPPRGHVRVIYLGPVAPHWDVQGDSEVRGLVDEFRNRVMARLLLLPPHDPQFRRNKERVARDAERENLTLVWDLGIPED
jgi:hypothetical protein